MHVNLPLPFICVVPLDGAGVGPTISHVPVPGSYVLDDRPLFCRVLQYFSISFKVWPAIGKFPFSSTLASQ